jgi:hypothetical protein
MILKISLGLKGTKTESNYKTFLENLNLTRVNLEDCVLDQFPVLLLVSIVW